MKRSAHVRTFPVLLAFGSLLAAGMPARVAAADKTASLTVNATVTNNCVITTGALAFAAYDPITANASANLEGTGVVTVACTKGVAPTIGLGTGSNAAGSTRRLVDGTGSNYLEYELFRDAGRSVVWSTSGAGLLSPVPATSKVARDFTVFGRINGNQDVPAGSYSDTVLATVNF